MPHSNLSHHRNFGSNPLPCTYSSYHSRQSRKAYLGKLRNNSRLDRGQDRFLGWELEPDHKIGSNPLPCSNNNAHSRLNRMGYQGMSNSNHMGLELVLGQELEVVARGSATE